ncbi:3-phosphoshikimate 1-carboxyvinyltransferase [Acidipropionibacterium thoenii]|uniref:3-phosphoshikimate 1-carboxyvinyltransferase n=1 Tax=Acidipropionibacterium thoenii TaxID=1751 RepID=UPI0004866ED7|nr:3-phosphoshikimate 1-carboxyvinyltransferase [Acidipropionibacterium thoenii]
MRLQVQPAASPLHGYLDIPVSKYHVHRALILAALADGRSRIRGVSTTRQVGWTIDALRALGVGIEQRGDAYIVDGCAGRPRLTDYQHAGTDAPHGLIDVGSSGTSLYFLVGLVSLADRPVTVTGMKYLRNRPIEALLRALLQMGVSLQTLHEDWRLPVRVEPHRPSGGHVEMPGTLSQWLSGVLLLAPFATSDTTVHITGGPLKERTYVELTITMMARWGLRVDHDDDWLTFHIPADQSAHPAQYTVPSDIGASAFGVAAAAIHPSDVLFHGQRVVRGCETDHPEGHFLDIARQMGVDLFRDPDTGLARVVSDGSPLRPIELDCGTVPDLLPVLSAMACFAEGTSRLYNVSHIRLKETDRVAAMLQLNKLGAHLSQGEDELRITGIRQRPGPGAEHLHGAELSSFNDHRVLMSLAVAATRATSPSTLTYPRAYRISYPTFLEEMHRIGMNMSVVSSQSTIGGPAGAAGSTDSPHTHSGAAPARSRRDSRRDIPEGLTLASEVLTDRVRRLSIDQPDAPAVIEVGDPTPVTISWSQLQAEADQVSMALLDMGVVKGDAVAIQVPNWVEFETIAVGVLQIGALITPIMPVFGAHEIAKIIGMSRARVAFVTDEFRHRHGPADLLEAAEGTDFQLEHVVVVNAADRRGHLAPAGSRPTALPASLVSDPRSRQWTWSSYREAISGQQPDADLLAALAPHPHDLAELLFTSGTTGDPKGVQHDHLGPALATALEIEHLGLGPDDRIYVPTPIAHQTGLLYGVMLAWQLGVAAVIQPVWNVDIALDRAFPKAHASFVQAATPFLDDLVDAVRNGAPAPESLRIFVATGAAVPRALARGAAGVLNCSVLGAFGSTESSLAALAAPTDDPALAQGADGRALPGIRLRVTDEDGVVLPTDQEGNFEIDSPTLFVGYLDRPDLTEQAFSPDGWFRTGDLARIDENGYLHITGRVKDIINRGGEKIPVVEVENLLYQHPGLADVAVVAMPDARLGERACAFVVAADGVEGPTFAQMQKYLLDHGLSKYYWPERLEYLDALPRNTVGKIQKNILREKARHLTVERKH